MTVLGFVWLVLLVVDLTSGLSPFLNRVSYVIWGLFVLQFLVEFTLAPGKRRYLQHNWLTALALVLPALRVLSAVRGVRLVRVLGSVNRGMRALGRVMGRRGFGYVAALTLLVTIAGAAGMYAFEHTIPNSGIDSFGSAVWWTAMTLTTMGSDYFPRSAEGRLLCLVLATYGFAVFGYVMATIASFFVARDADTDEGEIAGATSAHAEAASPRHWRARGHHGSRPGALAVFRMRCSAAVSSHMVTTVMMLMSAASSHRR